MRNGIQILIGILIMFSNSNCYNSDSKKKQYCDEFYSVYPSLIKNTKSHDDSLALIKDLSLIIQKNTKCIDAILTKGDLNLELNNYKSAYDDFEKVIKLDSTNIYALYKASISMYELKKIRSSYGLIIKAINIKERDDGSVVEYNSKYVHTKEARYDIDYLELIFRKGIAEYEMSQFKDAVLSFSYCISNNYKLDRNYMYRGFCYYYQIKKEKSCSDLFLAIRLGNSEAQEFYNKNCN